MPTRQFPARVFAAMTLMLLVGWDHPSPVAPPVSEPFADAEVFFELNTTANDLGLQIFLDAAGWSTITVADAAKHPIIHVSTDGPLSRLGLTELRFESAEPEPAGVLALFPPGEYALTGRTVTGTELASTATVSHDFLPAPRFSPSGGERVNPKHTVITWTAPGAERVEIILENLGLGHIFDVTVSGSTTSLDVPSQFLTPETEYKIEILAIGENGNRTIAESTFSTTP